MAKKKEPLPEVGAAGGELLEIGNKALENREREGHFSELLQENKEKLVKEAAEIRENTDQVIGLIRIDCNSPIQIQYRMDRENGAMDPSEVSTLQSHGLDGLFKEVKLIDDVQDLDDMVRKLLAAGIPLKSVLSFKLKPNADAIIMEKAGDTVTTREGLLPVENFLNRLDDIWGTLKDTAKDYIRPYMCNESIFKPFVELGKRSTRK